MLSEKLKEKISKIKNLKSENYLDKYFIFKTFYNSYKSPKRILSSPNKNQEINNKIFLSRLRSKNVKIFKEKSKVTNRILSLNSDYMYYSPYVTKMMTGGVDSTQYDSTKYTLPKNDTNKNSKIKKYFGIPGNTKITKAGTLSDLYSTTSLVSNTLSKKNSFSEQDIFKRKLNDEDRKIAEDFFIDYSRNKNFRMFPKNSKKNFYEKYSIDNKLTIGEEIKINNILDKNKKNKSNLNTIFRSINSDEIFDNSIHTQAINRLYKDPYSSEKKMKIKKQVAKLIENLNINFQCEKYQKIYNTICELNIQKNRMNNVKVIPKKKLKIFKFFNAELYLRDLDSNKILLEELERKKKKKRKRKNNEMIILKKPQTIYTRGEDLKEIELKVEYVPCIYHPEVRTKAAICFNREKGDIYLYGGLNGKKLADLWRFTFSQIKLGWKKIYEPNQNTDFENEPLPRFGHTIHFFNKKLYLIGGEFINWQNNEFREGIMCIFDLKDNAWDMMKYKYNIKWYNKKREEKKLTFRNKILSYQEITESIESKRENKNNKNVISNKIINHNNLKNKLENNKSQQKHFNKNIFNEKDKLIIPKTININHNKNREKIDSEESRNIFPELRRYHISLLIGTHIFLYGGETCFNKSLNDCWIYDLINNNWSHLDFIGRYPPPLFCHSACLVLEQNQLINEALNTYYKPPSEKKTLHLLKSDGVFFFGGYNESKIPTNLFFRMVIGIKPVIFEIPEIKGTPPCPRIEATMNFNSENNLIVIYGGRNDIKNEVYNDMILLDMENMSWVHTKFWGENPRARSEHNAVVISNKIFVFGGADNENFINFNFTIFNLDFFAQKYVIQNEI